MIVDWIASGFAALLVLLYRLCLGWVLVDSIGLHVFAAPIAVNCINVSVSCGCFVFLNIWFLFRL